MEKPIRILHIISKLSFGGVQSVVMNYYRNIDKKKVQFDFVVQNQEVQYFDDEVIKLGGRIHRVTPVHINHKKFEKDLYEILKKNSDYKIIHVHQNFMNLYALKIAKKAKVPIRISHSHSNYPSNTYLTEVKRKIFRKIIPLYATNFFSCSMLSGYWLYGKKNVNNPKFKIINNAIETENFKMKNKTRDLLRKKLNINDKLVFTHVGMFTEAKNHEFLIDVFKEIYKINNNVSLLLIGDGKNKEKLMKITEDNGLTNNILFLGEKLNVNEILMASDFFIFPSKYEGLGMALIEAQISGLTCFASEAIPKETDLFGEVNFIDENLPADNWANHILNNLVTRKTRTNLEIYHSGFDIVKETNILEDFYLKSFGNITYIK